MPNQNRIRRNGATKAAPVQSKTSRRQPAATPQAGAALYELEIAVRQSKTLAELVVNNESFYLTLGDPGQQERDRMNAGIADLTRQTNARLESAFKTIFHSICGGSEVAS
jgi:endo-beta-N-acetylglucosaminidase D